MPCFHAVACIFFQKLDPVDFIHECHKKDIYLEVYSHLLEPINGEEQWDVTEQESPLPPVKKIAPGRPKKNRDKRNDVVEARADNPTMLKRKGTSLQCSICKQWGHNMRNCQTKVRKNNTLNILFECT